MKKTLSLAKRLFCGLHASSSVEDVLPRVIIVKAFFHNRSLNPAIFFDQFLKLFELVIGDGDERLSGTKPLKALFYQFGGNALLLEFFLNEESANLTLDLILFEDGGSDDFAVYIA